jgi:hypothetical protein
LDALEPLVLDRFADWSAVREAAEEPFVVGAVRYLGETLIRNVPGRWAYQIGTNWPYGGFPLVRPNTPGAFTNLVIPLDRLGILAEDRVAGHLAGSIEELLGAFDRYEKAQRALARAGREN